MRTFRDNSTPFFKSGNLFRKKSNSLFFQTCSRKKVAKNLIEAHKIEDLNQCQIGCRWNNWKYIKDFGLLTEELYNLEKDPKEQNNLVRFKPKILFQMRKLVQEFIKNNPPLSKLKS